MNTNDKYAITIGRQFGSGGRLIGQALARELGIEYYDKALLHEAAKHAGMSPELFERKDEKAPSFFSGMMSLNMGYSAYSLYPGTSSISDDALYRTQSDVIRALADRSSCVIVGRSADYALRDRDNVINIFVHAPIEERVRRIMERGDATTAEQARQLAEKTNKLRELRPHHRLVTTVARRHRRARKTIHTAAQITQWKQKGCTTGSNDISPCHS